MERLAIIGAGGFGREVLDIIEACVANGTALEFAGFIDDGDVDAEALARRSATHLGGSALIAGLDAAIVIGIASPASRRRLDEFAVRHGRRIVALVHPLASIGSDNRFGDGAVLNAGARVTTNVTVGRHFHLHVNGTIGHDCVIGDYVSVYPGATVSGNVQLGDDVTIGTGANVIQGVTIGARTLVGAGAVVVRDLPADVTAVGVPARPILRRDG